MKTNKSSKNVRSFLLRFGLSAFLLWYLFAKLIDVDKTIETLKLADISLLIFAGVIFLFINFIILGRWFIYIRALGLEVSAKSVIRYFFIGLFGNLFLPSAIGGDLIKVVGLCRETHQKPRVVASVLLDRLSGFAAISLVAICTYLLGYRFIDDKSIGTPIIFMIIASVIIVAVLFNEKVYSFCCRIFNAFPKLKKSLMEMHYDISLMKSKKKEAVFAIGISAAGQIIFSFTYYLVAKALHQEISILYFLIFVPIICVASSFPSIGGLGVREVGAAYLFAKIGIDSGIAVSITLINFLFMVLIGLMGGVIYVSTLSSGRLQYTSPDTGQPRD